jgi:hypothetical protein
MVKQSHLSILLMMHQMGFHMIKLHSLQKDFHMENKNLHMENKGFHMVNKDFHKVKKSHLSILRKVIRNRNFEEVP